MKARDVDMHDVGMMREIADGLDEDDYARSGRLHAIAGLIERHWPELAECEHGALAGRCDICAPARLGAALRAAPPAAEGPTEGRHNNEG